MAEPLFGELERLERNVKLWDIQKKKSYEISQELLEKVEKIQGLEASNADLARSLQEHIQNESTCQSALLATKTDLDSLRTQYDKTFLEYKKLKEQNDNETIGILIQKLINKIFK